MCFWINVGLKSAHVTSTFSLSSYIFSAVLHSQRSHVSYQQERLGSVHMTVSFIIGPLKQEHLIHAEAQFMSHGFLLCRNFSLYNWRSSSYSAGLLAINHILSGNVKKKKKSELRKRHLRFPSYWVEVDDRTTSGYICAHPDICLPAIKQGSRRSQIKPHDQVLARKHFSVRSPISIHLQPSIQFSDLIRGRLF